MTYLGRRETNLTEIFDAETIGGSGTLTHAAIDLSNYSNATILVSTSTDCTVYFQISQDGTNWYTVTQNDGTARSYSVNNEKKAIPLRNRAYYLRVVIQENSGSDGSVDLDIVGQV